MTVHLNEDQLINYIYQLLSDAEREALDLHLSACPSCRTHLTGHEALQRRIHYSIAGRRRVTPSPRMSYAAIAPHLKRSRRMTMVYKQSHQFIYGAMTMALVVAVGIGVYFLVSNLSRPLPIVPEQVEQPTAIPTVEVSQPVINPTVEASQPAISPTSVISQSSPVELVSTITGDPNPLSGPAHLALDPQDNLYVVDSKNNRIQKFDRNGQFLTMWGQEGSSDGEFSFISSRDVFYSGLAVDGQGQVYVADPGNKRIQIFDGNGRFLAKWNSQGRGDGEFVHPIDVAVDSQGYVYVLDDLRGDVQKFDGKGQFLARWGGFGAGDGQFLKPLGLAADGQGNIYVADNGNHCIQKFDDQGQFLAKWGDLKQFSGTEDLTVDAQGNIYVADAEAHSIQKLDSQGQLLFKWGGFGDGDDQFNYPVAIAVDGEGYVYVSDRNNDRIQKFRLK